MLRPSPFHAPLSCHTPSPSYARSASGASRVTGCPWSREERLRGHKTQVPRASHRHILNQRESENGSRRATSGVSHRVSQCGSGWEGGGRGAKLRFFGEPGEESVSLSERFKRKGFTHMKLEMVYRLSHGHSERVASRAARLPPLPPPPPRRRDQIKTYSVF